jgi:hypothetical protein
MILAGNVRLVLIELYDILKDFFGFLLEDCF